MSEDDLIDTIATGLLASGDAITPDGASAQAAALVREAALAERARIVAWLRETGPSLGRAEDDGGPGCPYPRDLAAAIERGEHEGEVCIGCGHRVTKPCGTDDCPIGLDR